MAIPLTEREWLRPKEAAEYLGISLSTLYSWKRKGLVRFYRMGPRAVGLRRGDIDMLARIDTAGERGARRTIAEELWELNEEMRRKYGILPDSTPVIRGTRDTHRV